jgi:hypothetical protein
MSHSKHPDRYTLEEVIGAAIAAAIRANKPQKGLVSVLKSIDRKLGRILDILDTKNPGPLKLIQTGDKNGMITFKVQLPELPTDSSDIESGELTVTVAGVPSVYQTAKNDTEVTGLSGPKNANVDLSFVYIDAAGNRSANPSIASGVLVDTFPPPNPGALGFVEIAEVADPLPPAPPEEPPAPPEEPPAPPVE